MKVPNNIIDIKIAIDQEDEVIKYLQINDIVYRMNDESLIKLINACSDLLCEE